MPLPCTGLEGPVECAQRVRFDGRVERTRLAGRPGALAGPAAATEGACAAPGRNRGPAGVRPAAEQANGIRQDTRRQGISGPSYHGRIGHGRGRCRENGAARPLILAAPTTLWACRPGRRAGTWSASSARGSVGDRAESHIG
jgi:hypothetical protein